MQVELLYNTPLWVCAKAIRKCWASEDKSDTICHHTQCACGDCDDEAGTKDKELIERVGNKNKHASTLEHLVYTFDIDGISRACLQEVARHRMASYSVKSTRYTLKELKEANLNWEENNGRCGEFIVRIGDTDIDESNRQQLYNLQKLLRRGIQNDTIKFMLPEAYKTSLVMTINARSLQNFIALRTNKSALWEIQELAKAMFDALPDEHKYLFKECVYTNDGETA